MEESEALLSAKRLAKYQGLLKKDAVACHLFNCELAESFYSSLSYFEIILRNKIDKVFSKYLGENWIFQPQFIIGRNKDNMASALSHINDTKKNPANKDHIISELSLGFWVYLFLPTYNDVLWNKYPTMLSEIFDNSKDRSVLYRIFIKLNRIRMYRNKIFHYGSLLVVNEEQNRPEKIHNLIYRLIGDMNAQKLLKELKKIDNFNEKYQKGRKLGFLKQYRMTANTTRETPA